MWGCVIKIYNDLVRLAAVGLSLFLKMIYYG